MKNRWDTLKRMYTQWKTLNDRATGLGRDPLTGCICADDDWWAEQSRAMPGCAIFRIAPLENEDDLRRMFSTIVCTNESSVVPGAHRGDDDSEGDEVGDGLGDELGSGLGSNKNASPIDAKRAMEKRPANHDSPKGKKRKTFRDHCMKRLVDAYEKKTQSSSATFAVVNHVRNEIAEMLELVINDGAVEGSDEHYYATQLLKKKENRDVFITFKTTLGRLNWLRRAWEDK
ncbi:hypothetical protein BAE44_0020266 [Dichanthelium oligosanthes]|uniref:Uncharacterized protein n=1 Tax=Dichanthelium oligosanthes TaxID=888268 RepID=A0A1E5V0Y0_9POAL|nr:hypothetical protein BAE44_0020266 [Dichanthelium oligosanthes]